MEESTDTTESVVADAVNAEIQSSSDSASQEGKYLTFVLSDEEYGLEILKVREIISVMEITEVPQVPNYIKGVINLRGRVIPVIDLRLKFQMPAVEYTRETCIIVVNVLDTLLGIVVDTVAEVLDISSEDIDPSPAFGSSVDTNFILGMGKIKGKVKILLDIDRVLSLAEIESVKQAT